ncbi:MAG: DUF72 domain-containing protein [Pirellulaceae bacterium]
MTRPRYRLGCPVWACPEWQGSLYKRGSNREQWLTQYSRVFMTVEGNSTFYGLPDSKTAIRWCRGTADGFRFALKFPRSVTHDAMLEGPLDELDPFLDLLGILEQHDRLGPSLLQLPPNFDGQRLSVLQRFLESLPSEFPVAVEVRHADYFDQGPIENKLHRLLKRLKIDQALFDSRPLFSEPPDDEIERVSQSRKPRSPLRTHRIGRHPMLRLVGRNRLEKVTPWLDSWAQVVAQWIHDGGEPYVFTHAPDDRYAPVMASMFHDALTQYIPDLPEMPTWLGRLQPMQLELF